MGGQWCACGRHFQQGSCGTASLPSGEGGSIARQCAASVRQQCPTSPSGLCALAAPPACRPTLHLGRYSCKNRLHSKWVNRHMLKVRGAAAAWAPGQHCWGCSRRLGRAGCWPRVACLPPHTALCTRCRLVPLQLHIVTIGTLVLIASVAMVLFGLGMIVVRWGGFSAGATPAVCSPGWICAM